MPVIGWLAEEATGRVNYPPEYLGYGKERFFLCFFVFYSPIWVVGCGFEYLISEAKKKENEKRSQEEEEEEGNYRMRRNREFISFRKFGCNATVL